MKTTNILDIKYLKDGGWWFSQFGERPSRVSENARPWESRNGVYVLKNRNSLSIVTDDFGSVPVFFDLKNILFSNDLQHLNFDNVQTEWFDKPAFWESMIYDYSFNSRTSIKNIIQVPGGSIFAFNFQSREWSIERWNYFNVKETGFEESKLLASIDQRLLDLCDQYWKSLNPDSFILLPLSGGLDSRLLAVYLVLTGDPNRIKAVTFGFSKKSQEYMIAKQVCEELGIKKHWFHPVSREIYTENASDFWKPWRGCLSAAHGHLYSFLKATDCVNALLVTGFLADPIVGFAASERKQPALSLEKQPVYLHLLSDAKELGIEDGIFADIKADLNKTYREWLENCNRFEFGEYLYLSQRQSKTYALLLQAYRDHCRVVIPFADPALATLFLSAPYVLRKDKEIIRKLLSNKNANLANLKDLSSSISKRTAQQFLRSELRKWSSRISLILRLLTKDKVRYFSPYWTEDLIGAYRVECREAILTSLDSLYEQNILSDHQMCILKTKPLKSREVARISTVLSYLPAFLSEPSWSLADDNKLQPKREHSL
ncbi:MAG: asparagine synthase-related protein [Candidatus Berkelbacteria bacterium]|nr:asparagine synthase-related protein [Candidatus Berkelbacteria bacterium]